MSEGFNGSRSVLSTTYWSMIANPSTLGAPPALHRNYNFIALRFWLISARLGQSHRGAMKEARVPLFVLIPFR
jgi:hypothetical protein